MGNRLTDLQHVRDLSLLHQLGPTVERGVVVLPRRGRDAGQAGVHADVPLVPRERPEEDPLLHRLRDPRDPLLDRLEGKVLRHDLGARVQQRVGAAGGRDLLHPAGEALALRTVVMVVRGRAGWSFARGHVFFETDDQFLFVFLLAQVSVRSRTPFYQRVVSFNWHSLSRYHNCAKSIS